MLGVSIKTVLNWEKNITEPHVQAYPAIMEFLGYCPVQYAQSPGERIRLHRIHQGQTIFDFANIIGVDECTLRKWERSMRNPMRQVKSRAIIRKTFMHET